MLYSQIAKKKVPRGSNHGLHDHTDWQKVADSLKNFSVLTNEIEPVLPRQLLNKDKCSWVLNIVKNWTLNFQGGWRQPGLACQVKAMTKVDFKNKYPLIHASEKRR